MARDAKSKLLHARANVATAATAMAAGKALKAVDHCKGNGAKRAAKISDLVQLCGKAADHLSEANRLLFSNSSDAEDAINELDAALVCLQKVTATSAKRTNLVLAEEAESA